MTQDPDRNRIFFSRAMNLWVLTRHEDIVGVLKNSRVFSSARMYESFSEFMGLSPAARETLGSVIPLDTPHMANVDPPEHTRLRRAAAESFASERVQAYEPRIRDIAERLINGFSDGRAELVEQYTRPLPMLSILSVIGVPDVDMPRIRAWYADWTRLVFSPSSGATQEQYAASVRDLHAHFRDLVAERRRAPREDLASTLLHAVDVGKAQLSIEEVVSLLSQLLAAGSDTTTFSLGTCLHQLLEVPARWEALAGDPAAAARAAEEGLRYNRALRGPLRVATEEVTIGGQTIPAGARVYLLHTAANRDPAVFEAPNAFNPERKELDQHIAFGYGIHYCLGAGLARLEMKVALQALHDRLPTLRLAPGEAPEYVQSELVRPLKRLPVVW